MKVELDQAVWSTRHAAGRDVGDFIDRFYNTQRLHSTLDYQTPAGFEAQQVA